MSFAKLAQRFKAGMQNQTKVQPDPLPLATAAVLLETAYADGEFSPAEDGDVVGYLRRAFQLDDQAAQELIAEAAEIRNRTIDHFALTNFIRKNATLADRIEIVKTMWRIVYSDRKLTDYENYLVRKLADLLGLEHHVMIDAKVAVLRDMGLSS
ncbi:MAG TPA: TerB family tellurite resistance protein [Thermoanaerobaculia bacterium]|nr:TerB family tellurite resistance protein [Thermoanaerobaculia bacterium]